MFSIKKISYNPSKFQNYNSGFKVTTLESLELNRFNWSKKQINLREIQIRGRIFNGIDTNEEE